MDISRLKAIEVVPLKDWLDWSSGNVSEPFIALPMIQRGSVWRPQQIIELWDSLLQGMPIGCMMVSMIAGGVPVRRPGHNLRIASPSDGGLALIDGQQRTLAMLVAWSGCIKMDRRLWIDFAKEPAQGHLLRLRVTTENHPFGFKVNDPSARLSLGERRNAATAFKATHQDQPITIDSASPFSNEPGLPLDLRDLIDIWRTKSSIENWIENVKSKLTQLIGAKLIDRSEGLWESRRIWEFCDPDQKEAAFDRINVLASSLSRLMELELPLIRVDERFFDSEVVDDGDPPLATLFKRIGTGGTALSDADYMYSLIKHLRPETYDLVESLHHHGTTIASLLTATDLVTSVVRIAAVEWKPADNKPVPDLATPRKRDFHRLLRRGDFIDSAFLPMIQRPEKRPTITRLFNEINNVLHYRGSGDNGLPKQAFPLLKRPLVQVLLRLAQIGYLKDGNDAEVRNDILRLVLFWTVAVIDPAKPSRLAYETIGQQASSDQPLGKLVHDRLIAERLAVRLPYPAEISNITNFAFSEVISPLIRGESRFLSKSYPGADHSEICAFYRNYWWRAWTHEHPILLWIQRDMVSAKFDSVVDPLAGRDEDTPYDYDHILPYAHWGSWTGVKKGTRLPDFSDGQIHVIGNSIGNIRVWGSSLNRSDGDKPPSFKLELYENSAETALLLRNSAIPENDIEAWKIASSSADKSRFWDLTRALAFQRAVENRTFYLYDTFFNSMRFDEF